MSYKEKLKNIKALVFDVDGVMTDGKVFLSPDGSFVRQMDIKDGYALQFAVKNDYIIGIITGGADPMVTKRFKNLGITDIYTKSHRKYEDFEDLLFKYSLKPEEVLYMGDDVLDLEVIEAAGIGCAPNDAVPEAQNAADYISPKSGGKGCVRDVIEQVMRIQGKWKNFKKGF